VLRSGDASLISEVETGAVSLIAAADSVRGVNKLVTALCEASAEDRAAAVERFGVDEVFDKLIVPAL
jgi:hypothetical protein